MTIGSQFATRSEVEALRRKIARLITGTGIVQQSSDDGGGETKDFIDLADVPQTYGGSAGEILNVNAAEDGLEFNSYVTVDPTSSILTVRNLTDAEVDPLLKFALGATPVVKFTMGVDDGGSDYFVLGIGDGINVDTAILQAGGPEVSINVYGGYPWGQSIYCRQNTVRISTVTPEIGLSLIWLVADEVAIGNPVNHIFAGAELRFIETVGDNDFYVGFQAPGTLAASVIWTLPVADSSGPGILVSDGLGNLSFSNRIIDPALANIPDTSDPDTDALIVALRDIIIAHGLGSALGPAS